MVVWITVLSVVCKMMEEDSDGTLRYEGWLKGGR